MEKKDIKTETKGLGDEVKDLIACVAPKFAEKRKDCISCNKKRIWLNNFGAIFG